MVLPKELAAARLRVVIDRPYLASALWSLVPVERPGLGTMAVDKYWRLYYDPKAMERWGFRGTSTVLMHEVWHLLREHCWTVDPTTFPNPWLVNQSEDMEINDDLVGEGFELPDDPPVPSKFKYPDHLLWQQYYNMFCKCAKKGKGKRGKSGKGSKGDESKAESDDSGDGQQQGGGGGKGSRTITMGDLMKGKMPDDFCPAHDKVVMRGGNNCGSGAHGQQEEWELEAPDKGGGHGVSRGEGELIKRDVARKIQEHSTQRGSIPEGWKRWAELLMKPKVDWRKELASAIRRTMADAAGVADYAYSRPSRRQAALPRVILPTMRRPIPNAAVLIDTSGSMSDGMLSQCIAEVGGVLRATGLRDGVTVLAVDAAVHSCKKVFTKSQVTPLGGGGTELSVGVEHCKKLRPKPDVLIMLTDAYSDWGFEQPPFKVVIGVMGNYSGELPGWAKVVRIDLGV